MLTIRDATPSDVPTILALVRELATYEREPDAVVATEADSATRVRRAAVLQDAHRRLETALPRRFALYFFGFSTWTGGPTLYLEDPLRPAGAPEETDRRLARCEGSRAKR